MIKFNTSLTIIFLFFFSCKKKEVKTLTFETTGERIAIQLDNKTPNISLGFTTYNNMLFNIVWEYNEIQIYDIEKKSLIKKINLDIEGDQGVGQIFGYHIHNLDSIFLFGQNNPIIHLTDTSGKVKNRIKYNPPEGYSSAFVHPQYFISPPQIQDNEIIVKTHVTGNYRDMTNEILKQKYLVYSINLQNGQTRFLNHAYPQDYLENGLKHFEPSMAVGKDKVVYSLFGDHRLFYAESFDQKLQSKNTASQYLDGRLKLFPIEGERLETLQYMNTSSRYDNLIYDPYQDLYYRFAYPTLDITEQSEIQRLRIAPGPFVIMILDKDLNVLGETYFEKGKYLPLNFFIHEKGLYISINHPDNPENHEDEFKFELLKISEVL